MTTATSTFSQNTKGGQSKSTKAIVKGETYALVVGISKYQYIQSLQYADRDATVFYNYLLSSAGGSLDSSNIKLLLNEQGNIGEIIAGFQWLQSSAKPNDQVVIYFSGHGDVETITKDQHGYLLTYNTPKSVYMAGALSISILSSFLNTFAEQEIQVTLIADACRSGKLAGGDQGISQTGAALQKQWGNEVKILSCQPGELSIESRSIDGGRGLFSYHLIEGLTGLADLNNDKIVSLNELWMHLNTTVPQQADPMPQNPLVSGNMLKVIATVDPDALAALNEKRKKSDVVIASINSKGLMDDIINRLDAKWRLKYDRFNEYLDNKESYNPTEESAFSIFKEFEGRDHEPHLIAWMKRSLLAGMHNEAQDVINDYLTSHFNMAFIEGREEVAVINSFVERYNLAAAKLRECRNLVGPNNPFRATFQARQLFLESLANARSSHPVIQNQAISNLKLSIKIEPFAAYSYEALGRIYSVRKEYTKAIEYYQKAIELSPTWQSPQISIAIAHLLSRDYVKCREQLDIVFVRHPDDADAYLILGYLHHLLRNHVEEVSTYEQAIEKHPNSIQLLYGLAFGYAANDNFNKSLQTYKKVLSLDPDFVWAYTGMGEMYKRQESYSKALEQYERALELDPLSFNAYYGMGLTYLEMNDFSPALSHFNKAIEIDPSYPFTYISMGRLYEEQNEFQRSLEYLQMSIKADPNEKLAHLHVGYVLSKQKKYSESIASYKRAIDIDDNYALGYVGLGKVYNVLKNYPQAISNFNRAIDIDPKEPTAYYNLGYTYRHLLEYEKALVNFNKVLTIDPKNILALTALAVVYHDMGDLQQSVAQFEKALKIDPQNAYAHNGLGMVYNELKEYDKAMKCFGAAVNSDSMCTPAQHNLDFLLLQKERSSKGQKSLDTSMRTSPTYQKLKEYSYSEEYSTETVIYDAADLDQLFKLLDEDSQEEIESSRPYTEPRVNTETALNYFNMSIYFASIDQTDAALEYLELAFKSGFQDLEALKNEDSFDGLREAEAFRELLELYLGEGKD